jgi:flagellar motility protein MotE (MotC chaperone)
VNGKLILVVAAAGTVSFVGAFGAGWFSHPPVAAGAAQNPEPTVAQPEPNSGFPLQVLTPTVGSAAESASTRAMMEQQLKELIHQVREKIKEYEENLKAVDREKERLQIAQQVLKKDIEALNALRVELAATAAGVKSERDALLKARVEVDQVERTNLQAIAAAYDKMDAASASSILTNMATGRSPSGAGRQNASVEDAVKILHFMQDRTKAKVLAEMVAEEPALAAMLSQKLKQVQEAK